MTFRNNYSVSSAIGYSRRLLTNDEPKPRSRSKFAGSEKPKVGHKRIWPKRSVAASRRYQQSSKPVTNGTHCRCFVASPPSWTRTLSSPWFHAKPHRLVRRRDRAHRLASACATVIDLTRLIDCCANSPLIGVPHFAPLNDLNGAKRLNGWNDLNSYPPIGGILGNLASAGFMWSQG